MDENSKVNHAGSFKKGNQLWRLGKPNRNPAYTPESLWEKSCEYFQWVEDNPLWEAKSYLHNGKPVHDFIPKMRPMTIGGLCLFLGIKRVTIDKYNKDERYGDVVDRIRNVVREQKFAGAAAGLFNPQIIGRDLGMREVYVHEHTGADGGPITSITANLDPVEASRRYRELILEPVKQLVHDDN